MSKVDIAHIDAIEWLQQPHLDKYRCMFADPPDGINLKYRGFKDKISDEAYEYMLFTMLNRGSDLFDFMWLSINTRWAPMIGHVTYEWQKMRPDWEFKPCLQTFTFGQQNNRDFGNGHRLLYRYQKIGASRYMDAVRVSSWRQLNGDKRADPKGRVPLDVVDTYADSRDCLPLPVMSDKDIERFLSKIDRKGEGCWEWGAGKRDGYGRFRIGESLYGATRLMWRLTHGQDPRGSLVLHTCDNPSCCNPSHLFLGSHADNNKDKETKGRGRHPIGENNGLAKLCDEDVIRIYQSTEKGRDLAAQYSVSDVCIKQIREGNTWTHITGELACSDVFNFPRVTGNSKQRRTFSPTQLHEGLYERCIRSCCAKGDTVVDLFAGSGTLGRVASRCEVDALMLELSRETVDNILADQPETEEVYY